MPGAAISKTTLPSSKTRPWRDFWLCAGLWRPDSVSQKPRRPAAEAHVALVSSAKDAAENGGGAKRGSRRAPIKVGAGGERASGGCLPRLRPPRAEPAAGPFRSADFSLACRPWTRQQRSGRAGRGAEGRGQVHALSPWQRCRHGTPTPPLSILRPLPKPVGGSLTTFLRCRTFPPPPWLLWPRRGWNPDPPSFPRRGFVLSARAPALRGAQAGFARGADGWLSWLLLFFFYRFLIYLTSIPVFAVESGGSRRQPPAMAILFAVVARGSTILAKHAWCGGNFLEVTEQILAKIPSENNKLTYSHGNYLFHYICQDRIIYLCITDDNFERSRAFTFLNEIKKRFQTTYGSRAQTALPYAMNSEFSSVLAAQLKYHSENKGPDQMVETQAQVDELKGIMVRNIDLVAQRGEKLELLIDKTENLVDSSVTFKTTSRNLARAMCMKNLKLTIIVVIVSIVIIYIIVSAACGGLSWPNCVKK
ncbi:vesicle-associated membrane protein 7 [Crotalus adamanteus]|uniref:Vesicle-associated membrane protein 7 n=3 Tax=Colubroidea TaxID=34989 RepID=A0AAW1AVJ9_CROAD